MRRLRTSSSVRLPCDEPDLAPGLSESSQTADGRDHRLRTGHAEAVTERADAAIVGSALVRRMGEADDPTAAARQFVAELTAGLTRNT